VEGQRRFEGDHNAGYGHGHGHTTYAVLWIFKADRTDSASIMDQNYETIRELRAGDHKLTDKHEFHIVSDNTAVIQIYQPVPRDLTPWGASDEQQWIVNAIFQEIDITTGDMLFQWASLDYVTPSGMCRSPQSTLQACIDM
jgi:hypothetical protein